MKIAIISPLIFGFTQSAETYSSQQLNLSEQWVNQGHRVDILTSQIGGVIQKTGINKKINIYYYPAITIGGKYGLPIMFGGFRQIRKGNYDIVLSSEHYQITTLLACLASKRVIIYQGQNTKGATTKSRLMLNILDNTIVRFSRSRYLYVIAKTKQAAEFVRLRGFNNVKTIPCGFNEKRFRTPNREERELARQKFSIVDNGFVFVYAGNLLPRRNVSLAIRAFKENKALSNRKSYFIIAGDGEERSKLEKLTSELGITDTVIFTGILPWWELREVFWAGNVFVFLPFYEIFGMALLEAMACGLVPVTTNIPMAQDLINDGHNGIKVSHSDIEQLTAAFNCLQNNEKEFNRIRLKTLNTTKNLSWSKTAEEFISVFKKCINMSL